MASYNNNQPDFNSMQQEAVRRVREMQKRSREMTAADNGQTESPQTPAQEPVKQSSPLETKPASNVSGTLNSNFKITDMLGIKGLEIDEEKALIALLIYILYKQGSDIKLLLGLGYLLL